MKNLLKQFSKILLTITLLISIIISGLSISLAQSGVDSSAISSRVGCFLFTKNLKYRDGIRNGMQDEVTRLQSVLKQDSYNVQVTGYFGVNTLNAVKKFQKDNNILPTGYVGAKTLGVLRSIACKGTTESIAMCSYANPPVGCEYVPGSNYDARTSCGMVLKCNNQNNDYDPASDVTCNAWNDGCNTCSKQSPKGFAMCTLMACLDNTKRTPYCISRFETPTNTIPKANTCLDGNTMYNEGYSTSCLTKDGGQICIADAAYVCRTGEWKIEGGMPITKLKVCPTEKIINRMPVMCITAPCPAVESSYYIYNGSRKEVSEFDTDWVQNNCSVRESVVY